MRKELTDNCQRCEARPACELAGQKYEQLEKASTALGFTVTEGSVICEGRIPGSLALDINARCGARLVAPDLATPEERKHIAELAILDESVNDILPATQALVQGLKS